MSNPDPDYYPSSTTCRCCLCGALATFHGKPEEVNAAAAEFYRIHNEAHDHPKEQK